MNVLLIGFFSGIFSGAGMGGGTVLIPMLTLLLNTPQKDAQTINFLAFLPAASVALLLHWRAGRAVWPLVLPVLPWGFLGAAGGLVLALIAPQECSAGFWRFFDRPFGDAMDKRKQKGQKRIR